MRLRRRTGETNLDAHILVLQEQGDRRSLHWSHVREPERVHYLQRHGGKRRLDRPERQHGKVVVEKCSILQLLVLKKDTLEPRHSGRKVHNPPHHYFLLERLYQPSTINEASEG